MLRFAIMAMVALWAGAGQASDRLAVRGPAHVVDGDTFVIDGQRIRLHGIDAVEGDQRCGGEGTPMWACGKWVTAEVKARYEGRVLECFQTDTDRYSRIVAVCMDGTSELNRDLVRGGLAFAYPKYSDRYIGDEAYARRVKAGLFGTGVMRPAAFRAVGRQGREAQLARAVPQDCKIKGNINSNGVRIYHVPGQEYYTRTKISPSKGERYFCTEAEARAAGWRRSKV